MIRRVLFLVAALALAGALALPISAQTAPQTQETTPPAKSKNATPGINKRQRNQQRRIRQGVKSGELTKHETRRLEREEGKIQADKLQAKSDGKVTKAERKQLHKELNKAIKDIHKQKHDAQKQPRKNPD
jgi:hypothetical protein